jgi:hypothetical protein
MLKRKVIIEKQKESAEQKLAARLESLQAGGMEAGRIAKDATVKQIKAQIREAKHRIAGINAMETLTAQKAEARAQKEAAAKAPRQETKKAAKSAAPKKPKKEKKPVQAEPQDD